MAQSRKPRTAPTSASGGSRAASRKPSTVEVTARVGFHHQGAHHPEGSTLTVDAALAQRLKDAGLVRTDG